MGDALQVLGGFTLAFSIWAGVMWLVETTDTEPGPRPWAAAARALRDAIVGSLTVDDEANTGGWR
jgi:hypothetical protein